MVGWSFCLSRLRCAQQQRRQAALAACGWCCVFEPTYASMQASRQTCLGALHVTSCCASLQWRAWLAPMEAATQSAPAPPADTGTAGSVRATAASTLQRRTATPQPAAQAPGAEATAEAQSTNAYATMSPSQARPRRVPASACGVGRQGAQGTHHRSISLALL